MCNRTVVPSGIGGLLRLAIMEMCPSWLYNTAQHSGSNSSFPLPIIFSIVSVVETSYSVRYASSAIAREPSLVASFSDRCAFMVRRKL